MQIFYKNKLDKIRTKLTKFLEIETGATGSRLVDLCYDISCLLKDSSVEHIQELEKILINPFEI